MNDAWQLKAALHIVIAKLKFFWASSLSCRHIQCVSFRFAVERHVNATYRACAMDWGRNRIPRVGKNSGPILSRLWTKVDEIWGQCRGPLILSIALARLFMSCFVQKTFAMKSKTNKCKRFWPQYFWEGRLQLFYGRLLARFTVHRL